MARQRMSDDELSAAYCRAILAKWIGKFGHRITQRKRNRMKRQLTNLKVNTDPDLQDTEYDGFILWGRPTTITVAPEPEMPLKTLLQHEAAHWLVMWRWHDTGHGARFTRTMRELQSLEEP